MDVYNLFSQTDPKKHAQERRPIARYYSVNSILTLEPHMDKVIDHLCQQLETKFIDGHNRGRTFDMGDWIQYCTSTLLPLALTMLFTDIACKTPGT